MNESPWKDFFTPVVDDNAGHADESGCWKYNPRGPDVSAGIARDLEQQAQYYRFELGAALASLRDAINTARINLGLPERSEKDVPNLKMSIREIEAIATLKKIRANCLECGSKYPHNED